MFFISSLSFTGFEGRQQEDKLHMTSVFMLSEPVGVRCPCFVKIDFYLQLSWPPGELFFVVDNQHTYFNGNISFQIDGLLFTWYFIHPARRLISTTVQISIGIAYHSHR
jgi:hypothetical protein